jgi:hypothetical protein
MEQRQPRGLGQSERLKTDVNRAAATADLSVRSGLENDFRNCNPKNG